MNRWLTNVLLVFFAFIASNVAAQAVKVEEMGSISLNEMGLITVNEGGIGFDAYQKSNGQLIQTLLLTLPESPVSEVAIGLRNRVLVSITQPPESSDDDFLFWKIKLVHLARSGQSEAVMQMINSAPAGLVHEAMHAMEVAGYFVEHAEDGACPLVSKYVQLYDKSLLWRKMLIYCQFLQDASSAANLGVSLLKEEGHALKQPLVDIYDKVQSSKTRMAGEEAFATWIKDTVLPINIEPTSMPSVKHLYASTISGGALRSWFSKLKDKTPQDQLNAAARYYVTIERLEEVVDPDDWYALLNFALTNKLTIPDALWTKLLDDAAFHQRKAEAILLVLHAVEQKAASKVSAHLLTSAVDALNSVGLPLEARKLALEGMIAP